MLVENISNDGDSNQKNGINERDSGLDSTIWWVGIKKITKLQKFLNKNTIIVMSKQGKHHFSSIFFF